jgi:ABC-type multidrug transport system fused ATPase/permease subunit
VPLIFIGVVLIINSGGGKSTVLSLIMRLYDVSNGAVMLDGHDVRTYVISVFFDTCADLGRLNVNWLREQIVVVEQTTTLFDGTIFENIAVCKDGATLQEVQEAAQLVSRDMMNIAEMSDRIAYRPTRTTSSCRSRLDTTHALATMETNCLAGSVCD